MARVPELMALFAPTINSYKRYLPGSWAPVGIAWSYDNRTAGFRVVGQGDSLRIECRIPGADCNPYLAYAAALADSLPDERVLVFGSFHTVADALRADAESVAGV